MASNFGFGNPLTAAQDYQKVSNDLKWNSRGKNNAINGIKAMSTFAYQPAVARLGFNAGLEGQYQNTLQNVLNQLTNQNYAVQGAKAANRVTANYARAQAMADQQARAMGLGEGARLGRAQGLSGAAARDASAAQAAYMDPRRGIADQLQALGAMQQAQGMNPYYDLINGAFQPLETARMNSTSLKANNKTLWDSIGGLGAQAASNWVNGATKRPGY